MQNTIIRTAAGIAILISTGASGADYRLVAHTDTNWPGRTVVAGTFIKGVESASAGRIKITQTGPEGVPPFEALRTVSAGAFQFIFSTGGYHAGTTAMGQIGDTLIKGDLEARRNSGIYELLDRHYAKHNLKIIALPISKSDGFNFVLKAPLTADGDLKGRKIRTTPTNSGASDLLGATMVVLPGPEVYSALEKGVVGGAIWPALGVVGTNWLEVAKYVVRPTFGIAPTMLMMNLPAWNALSDADKKILLDEGRKVEKVWYEQYSQLVAAEEKEITARGGIFVEVGPKFRDRLNSAWVTKLWNMIEQKNGDEARTAHKLLKDKGLTD